MSPTKPAPVAIVGGGPCGLTLARLLERAGLEYVVFERDASADAAHGQQGGTLDLHPGTGQAALAAAGLTAEFEAAARREAAVLTVQDSLGGHFYRHHSPDDGRRGTAADRPEIDRAQLRAILLASVPAARVRWGKALRAVEREGDGDGAAGCVLRFADGSAEKGFRLVVGADGAWSKVRPLITPAKPKYSGKTFFEGRISHANPQYAAAQALAGPGNSLAIGAGRALVVQQMADRTYRVYAGLEEPDIDALTRPDGGALHFPSPSPPSSSSSAAADAEDAARAALLARFDGWAPHLRRFIECAEGPWRVWPLHTFSEETYTYTHTTTPAEGSESGGWKRARGVVLLGDAAHVTLPNGEGVNAAMLDALRLCEFLVAELGTGSDSGGEFDPRADGDAVERAIVRYEDDMLPRAREHVADGVAMGDVMYAPDGAERMIAMFASFAEQAGQA